MKMLPRMLAVVFLAAVCGALGADIGYAAAACRDVPDPRGIMLSFPYCLYIAGLPIAIGLSLAFALLRPGHAFAKYVLSWRGAVVLSACVFALAGISLAVAAPLRVPCSI
jgi:hypothetical protein